jgi:hypothetical protein
MFIAALSIIATLNTIQMSFQKGIVNYPYHTVWIYLWRRAEKKKPIPKCYMLID